MENKVNNKNLKLLPNKAKMIGIGLAIICLVLGVVMKSTLFAETNLELYGLLVMSGLIAGLLIITLSKEKVEDEMINNLRAQAMQFAFIFAVVSTMIRPFMDVLFGDPVELEKAHTIVFSMLLVYNLFFLYLKKKA